MGTRHEARLCLAGGWTNYPNAGHWTAGYPTCFLAKYDSNGALQWVVSFGQQAAVSAMSDVLVDNNGGCYVGFLTTGEGSLAHFSSSGSNDWIVELEVGCYGCSAAIGFGGLTATNCGLLRFDANL